MEVQAWQGCISESTTLTNLKQKLCTNLVQCCFIQVFTE